MARYTHKHRRESLPPGPDATRFSLIELIVLTACAGITFALISYGLNALGVCFLVTIVAFRTSLVDFTAVGGCATLLTVVFGFASIALLVIRTIAAGN